MGDSRAIIGMHDDSFMQTKDHKPGDKAEYARLTGIKGVFISNDYGIMRVQGSLCLSRAIGDHVLR